MKRPENKSEELTVATIAEAVEEVFGRGSVGLSAKALRYATDEARSAFVRASLYLIVIQRLEEGYDSSADAKGRKSRATHDVREELALLLHVDENEVFRLHHHAAGLRAKDREYREKARCIERRLAEKYGLGV